LAIPLPNAPRYKREPIAGGEPGLAQHNETAGIQPLENGLFLEIEDPDPWAHDTEPVFWTE
jgi:hypothetical protein